MASTAVNGRTAARPGRGPMRPTNRNWAIGMSAAALALWAFYTFAMPALSPDAAAVVRQWLPLTAVNECLVWAICAIGLNIVVGYAGLLDLGFVAFWAIGGYTAGWLMSGFFHQVNIHVLSAAPPNQPGIHINWWIVLAIAGAARSGASSSAPRRCGSRATTWPS